jgi:hypothetical protein
LGFLRQTRYAVHVRTKAIVGGLVLIALLLFIGILFVPRSLPAFTVRHFERNVSLYGITQTFAVTNNGAGNCYFYPTGLEVLEGTNWKTCIKIGVLEGINWKTCIKIGPSANRTSGLGPHESTLYNLKNTRLPAGQPLRLKMAVGWELKGFSKVLARYQLRRSGNTSISLNPFDKSAKIYSVPTEVLSNEFMETEPQQK